MRRHGRPIVNLQHLLIGESSASGSIPIFGNVFFDLNQCAFHPDIRTSAAGVEIRCPNGAPVSVRRVRLQTVLAVTYSAAWEYVQ